MSRQHIVMVCVVGVAAVAVLVAVVMSRASSAAPSAGTEGVVVPVAVDGRSGTSAQGSQPAASAEGLRPSSGGDAVAQAAGASSADPVRVDAAEVEPLMVYGRMPAIDPTRHPQAAAVAAALEHKSHPERLSPLVPATPFDAQEYARNPQAYLAVSEPGRVFQVAQPGADTPPLRRISGRLHRVQQGHTVTLKAHAIAGAPVSFTAFDGGRFQENTLPSKSKDKNIRTVYCQSDDAANSQPKHRTPSGISGARSCFGPCCSIMCGN